MGKESEAITKALIDLVCEIPCCTCCESDEGYRDCVIEAVMTLAPSLSSEQKTKVAKAGVKDFTSDADFKEALKV